MNASRWFVAVVFCWPMAFPFVQWPSREVSPATHDAAKVEQVETLNLRVLSVAPSGIKNYVHDWVAEVQVVTTESKSSRRMRLFMHSPVLTFGVPAKELPGEEFRIRVEQRDGGVINRFDVLGPAM